MALKQIHSKKELDNFTEEQIVRDPNSDKIFIKDGDNPIVDESAGNTGSLGNTLTTSDAEHFNRSRTISKIIAKEVSKGAAQSGLNMAKQAGLSLFNPSNIRSAINAGGSTNLDIKDIYSATLDRISTAEQTRKEGTAYLSQMIEQNSKLWDSLTGEEVDYIKRFGVPSEMTLAKISQYKQEHPEEDKSFVLSLRNKYWDAGIESTDTPEQARQKIENSSAIYRKENSGGGTTPPDLTNYDISTYITQNSDGEWGVDGDALAYVSGSDAAFVMQEANKLADEMNNNGQTEMIEPVNVTKPRSVSQDYPGNVGSGITTELGNLFSDTKKAGASLVTKDSFTSIKEFFGF